MNVRRWLTSCPILALAAPVPAQTELARFDGPNPGTYHYVVVGGGDIDGDGAEDLIVGAPLSNVGATQAGSVYAYSGADHSILWETHYTVPYAHFGWSIARTEQGWYGATYWGDALIVGAPGDDYFGTRAGRVYVVTTADGALGWWIAGIEDGERWGHSVAWADLEHTGKLQPAGGAPFNDNGGTNAGFMAFQRENGTWRVDYGDPGEQRGSSLTAGHFDAAQDGFVDLAVGAPAHDGAGSIRGRVVVYESDATTYSLFGEADGDRFGYALGTAEISAGLDGLLVGEPFQDEGASEAGRVRMFSGGLLAAKWTGTSAHDLFGSSVCGVGDLDDDGRRDWVAGATQISGGTPGAGYVRAVSGLTGLELWTAWGESPNDQFGLTVADAGDFNGDGAPDVAVGSLLLSSGVRGRAGVVSGRCGGTVTYCAAGVSAAGCTPTLSTFGSPSASQPAGYVVQAWPLEGTKNGLFFFGTNGRQANPWGNGTSVQCVAPPVVRGGLLAGTGIAGTCSGLLTQDLNTLWQTAPPKNPGAGALVQLQCWYRDPLNTSNQPTSMSDAIEFVVCP